jgi:hypothetical protein
MSKLKVNPDKLRDALQLLADSSNPQHPGLLQGALDAAFEAAEAKPLDPSVDAVPVEAPSEAPPSDPTDRESWLQQELDKLRRHRLMGA